jgi:hypothetical protein
MSASVEIKDLPCGKVGDYWPPSPDADAVITIGPVTVGEVNSQPPENALTRVVMTFKKSGKSFVIDSDATNTERDGLITITDGATWTAEIPTIVDFLPDPGFWKWDLSLYHAGSVSPLTPAFGTLEMSPQV